MAVVTVAFEDLDSWLQTQPENTVDTPYELNITGLTASDIGSAINDGTLGYILNQNPTKYVDLSNLELPVATSLKNSFVNCKTLIYAPVLPNGVTNMMQTFQQCVNLKEAPVIPNTVTSLNATFTRCDSLIYGPIIPSSVTDMSYTFSPSNLIYPPMIPDSVTNMTETFAWCSNLAYKPAIPESVVTKTDCYYNVTQTLWGVDKSQLDNWSLSENADAVIIEVDAAHNRYNMTDDYFYGIPLSNLKTWIQSLEPNERDNLYKVCITGLTLQNYTNIKTQLYGLVNWHIDFSYTKLPNGITNATEIFFNINCISKSPVFPDSVTNMEDAFYTCDGLIEMPNIPPLVTNLKNTFQNCSRLVVTTQIPSSVTNMEGTFSTCSSLVVPPTIPSSVTNMKSTFHGCSKLEKVPNIPDGITNLYYTFAYCSSLEAPAPISSNVTNLDHTYYGCTKLEFKYIIPDNVSTTSYCYQNVPTKKWRGTASQLETWIPAQTSEFECWEIEDLEPTGKIVYGVDLANVDTLLNSLDENTIDTPYELKVINIEQSYISLLADKLYQAKDRYVDLRYTIYPYYASIKDQYGFLLYDSENLIYPPSLPEGITSLISAFGGCTNLKEAPTIPSTVTNLSSTFANCRSMTEAPTIPSAVTNLSGTFSGCTGITTPPTIPSNVTNMSSTFSGCSNLESAPIIPNGVTSIDNCFKNCTFSQAPAIPSSVTSMNNAFEGTNITEVALVPSSVTSAAEAFKNCSSLRKINEFQIPLNTLKNNANFQNMFQGCTSLTEIGYVIKESNWHVWRLKFGSNTVEGKVFFDENTSVTIPQTSITKSDLNLPLYTDELWFPHGQEEDDAVVDAKITDMLSQKYGVFKKSVIPPDEKTMVLWADNKDHFMTNIEMGGGSAVDVVEEDNMNPVTSNAVFESLLSKDLQKNGTFGLLGGARQSNSTNFADLIHEITGSNYGGGLCGGSINTTASSKGIPAGWYNFLYIPHKTGVGGGDNHLYGTLLVFPMTSNTQYFYYIHHTNGTVNTAVPSYAVPTSKPSLLPNGSLWIA